MSEEEGDSVEEFKFSSSSSTMVAMQENNEGDEGDEGDEEDEENYIGDEDLPAMEVEDELRQLIAESHLLQVKALRARDQMECLNCRAFALTVECELVVSGCS